MEKYNFFAKNDNLTPESLAIGNLNCTYRTYVAMCRIEKVEPLEYLEWANVCDAEIERLKATESNTREKQLALANSLGVDAFNDGLPCAPARNEKVLDMLKGREIGKTPEGEADTIEILKAYMYAWNTANLAFTRKKHAERLQSTI